MANKKKKVSDLQNYMRMCYEEFAELLLRELHEMTNSPKTVKKTEEAIKSLLDKEFGKDTGGAFCK